MSQKRFIILTQYYPPEPGAASLRLEAMAQQLQSKGHGVEVVTATPHHLGAVAGENHRWRWFYREKVHGVSVLRCWIFRVPTGRFWLRLLNYFSFVVTGFLGLLTVRRGDYLIVESPPLFLGITAFLYSRLRRTPYILSVSDLWPDSAVALGLVTAPWMIRMSRALEYFLYRHAAYVSSVTEGIQQDILNTGQVPATRALYFPNGVNVQQFRRTEPGLILMQRLDLEGKKVFLYPGTMGYAQGLSVIIDTADRLRMRTDIVFLLVGDGPVRSDLTVEVSRRNLNNVLFEPLQPIEQMPQYFSLARAVIVPLRRHKLFRGARPSKVFPAWACEVPVIYTGEGEMAQIIDESNGGMVVEPEDADALACAVVRLADMDDLEWRLLGRMGYQYVVQNYSWDKIADRWIRTLGDSVNF